MIKRSFLSSLILHGLVALSLLSPDVESNKQKGSDNVPITVEIQRSGQLTPVTILPPPSKVTKKSVQKIDQEPDGLQIKQQVEDQSPCKDKTYGGIGITVAIKTMTINDTLQSVSVILELGKGYPAERAGLNVGDIIIEPPPYQIQGQSDTLIFVKFIRDGILISKMILREEVCYDGGR